MADERLRQLLWDVRSWNEWRQEHPSAAVEIEGGSYAGQALDRANLHGAVLYNCDFSHVSFGFSADLNGAKFRECRLVGASFRRIWRLTASFGRNTDLTDCDFRSTDLYGSRFEYSNLTRAIFENANVREVEIVGCELDGSSFAEATFGETRISRSNLGAATGLADAVHSAPSYIDAATIRLSTGQIPATFLRGCGFADNEISLALLADPRLTHAEVIDILYDVDRLRGASPIQKQPVFISYSHKDEEFVQLLERHLDEARIRYWRDVHDLVSGRTETQLDRALTLNPTVLLLLSANSVSSDWVEWEAYRSRELEKQLKRDVLCPLALDDAWKTCDWPAPLRQQIADYNILNFGQWRDPDVFRKQFRKLREGLHLFYLRGPV